MQTSDFHGSFSQRILDEGEAVFGAWCYTAFEWLGASERMLLECAYCEAKHLRNNARSEVGVNRHGVSIFVRWRADVKCGKYCCYAYK